MNRRAFWILLAVFLLFYTMNYLMPLAFGDDYLYAFIWQGNPMYVPLTEAAVKVASFQDLITSQISFYYTWSGRVMNNTLSQLFIWAGKDVFNIFNAFASLLLVMEMYWCANKGRVTLRFNSCMFCWLFLLFWTFTPGFPSVVFWLVGACHYLWPAVLLTGFLIPYIHKYYSFELEPANKYWYACYMFLFGLIAGCTNENSVCWVILLLSVFIFVNRKRRETEFWMYIGLTGLVLGYAILMFAPGNYERLLVSHGKDWLNLEKISENLHAFLIALVSQFVLWYFCLRSLLKISYSLKKYEGVTKVELCKEILIIKVFCVMAMCMSACMVFSPEFHLRSAFPGTVQLIITTGILLRIQKKYRIDLLHPNAKKFLTVAGVVFFVISSSVTLKHLYEHQVYNANLLSCVAKLKEQGNEKKKILYLTPFPTAGKIQSFLSGYHTFDANVTDDTNSWINVAFARYYGIKGVRVLNSKDAEPEKK